MVGRGRVVCQNCIYFVGKLLFCRPMVKISGRCAVIEFRYHNLSKNTSCWTCTYFCRILHKGYLNCSDYSPYSFQDRKVLMLFCGSFVHRYMHTDWITEILAVEINSQICDIILHMLWVVRITHHKVIKIRIFFFCLVNCVHNVYEMYKLLGF